MITDPGHTRHACGLDSPPSGTSGNIAVGAAATTATAKRSRGPQKEMGEVLCKEEAPRLFFGNGEGRISQTALLLNNMLA